MANLNESVIVAKFAKAVELYERMVHSANETEQYKQQLMEVLCLPVEERTTFAELLQRAASGQKEETNG